MLLSISAICTNGDTQSRQSIDEESVAVYADAMRNGDEFPPVVVFHDGSAYWLADGFHRVFAARRAEFQEIAADVRQGTREDALWYSIGANKTNATRRTRGDIRHAVELALKTWPERSQVAIAEQVGCSQSMVSYCRSRVINVDNAALPNARTDSIGRNQPTSKPRKAKTVRTETQVAPLPDEGYAPTPVLTDKERRELQQHREQAFNAARIAISRLQDIASTNPFRSEALDDVVNWINFNR